MFTEQVQDDDDLFKSIKLTVSAFVGGGSMANKIFIKCRYLKADERIDNKVKKIRKNSSVIDGIRENDFYRLGILS